MAVTSRIRVTFDHWTAATYRRLLAGHDRHQRRQPAAVPDRDRRRPGQPDRAATAAALGGVDYLAFFAPGMLAAGLDAERHRRVGLPGRRSRCADGGYRAAVATPLEPVDILYGHALFMAVRVAMSAAAFLVVMVAMGAAPLAAGRAHPAGRRC